MEDQSRPSGDSKTKIRARIVRVGSRVQSSWGNDGMHGGTDGGHNATDEGIKLPVARASSKEIHARRDGTTRPAERSQISPGKG